MLRALFVWTTIVAAFSVPLAAAPAIVEDAPIAPSVVELAVRLDLEPARDGARFMADLARALYGSPDAKEPVLSLIRPTATPAAPGRGAFRVQVPLPLTLWSSAVFKRRITSEQLVAAIVGDRRAALLCRGLSGLDDKTLLYLTEHPSLVTWLYENAAPLFAAFGDSFRVDDGRVVLPGGAEAVALWEAALSAPASDPARFARTLFGGPDGRVAYVLATLSAAPPAAVRFALGLWIVDRSQRTLRFKALITAAEHSYREWHPAAHPFARPLGDLAMLLVRVRVDESGLPAPPASRAFWGSVFQAPVEPGIGHGEGDSNRPFDAAWLVGAIGGEDMYARVERLDQLAFAQRMFPESELAADGHAASVVAAFRRYRMLLVALERMGVHRADLLAAGLQQAHLLGELGGEHRFWTTAQHQASLAILARASRQGTLTPVRTERLLQALFALPLRDGEFDGGIGQWIRGDLASDLAGDTWEARLISLVAGTSATAALPRLAWEGQTYRLDLAYAERQRIGLIRRKQGGPTVDTALTLNEVARQLRTASSLAEVGTVEARLRTLIEDTRPQLRHPSVNLMPPGVPILRDASVWLDAEIEELSRMTRPGDLRRAQRLGASLQQLADIALGNALLSVVYAAEMGDPEGPALLAGNVALRHDFGFGRKDSDLRTRLLWAQPRQDFQPGTPWHVTGSLLGLDIALAPLSLRRLSMDRIASAPRISSIEREGLAVGAALLDPARMTDRDRDAIAAAIDRGRVKVKDLVEGRLSPDAVAEQLGLDGRRHRSLRWMLETDRPSVAPMFSLSDLMTLGGGADGVDLDAWGASGLVTYGCACTRYSASRAWRLLDGRAQLPLMSGTIGDANLALALATRELHLPAALIRSLLMVGLPDVIDDLAETSGDWWSLARAAQSLRRQRIEDYVSSTAAVDGPLVPEDDSDPPTVQ